MQTASSYPGRNWLLSTSLKTESGSRSSASSISLNPCRNVCAADEDLYDHLSSTSPAGSPVPQITPSSRLTGRCRCRSTRLRGRIAHAAPFVLVLRVPCAGLCWTSSRRGRESGAPSAVGGVQADGQAFPTSPQRSTVLDRARPRVARLAHGPDPDTA